jgi:N6-adenosine-specific RNA methylase IME4
MSQYMMPGTIQMAGGDPIEEYPVILADPPWSFKNWSKKGEGRNANQHYKVITLKEMSRMVLPAAPDCALFMWVTDPLLPFGLEVMRAWGFEYKTVAFTWAKTGKHDASTFPIGTGYWTRANPEMCLFGTRGKPKRKSRAVRQLITAPRREHSRKPDEIYDRIEALVDGPYLEMFARNRRPGWSSMGLEIDKFTTQEEAHS